MIKKKIFVTTGSSLGFDCLVELIDSINLSKKYDVIVQIGKGKYIPENCNSFDFKPNIKKYYLWADLIITHTGGTTLSEICLLKKKVLSISNPDGYKGIYEIAKVFDNYNYIKFEYFENINVLKLTTLIEYMLSSKTKFKIYPKNNSNIGDYILKYIR